MYTHKQNREALSRIYHMIPVMSTYRYVKYMCSFKKKNIYQNVSNFDLSS